ncbi:Transposase [Pseudomonas wadenswilerensis]|uniref:Transposase n=1 Tax=Pseudomonas wadenswilerensis TaxID=1785161 RepID=A0A380SZM3_9PSED|nr:hypothetical protein CCOS864_02484 [Pseudomonas wadenswilerensis]
MLPLIINGNRTLTFIWLGAGCVTTNTDLYELAFYMCQSHICHFLPLIDGHQLIKHGFTWLFDLAQKAKVSRLW